MTVLQLVRSSHQDTVLVLRSLLKKAEAGKLTSFYGGFELSNGTEESVFTGRYARNPQLGASRALQLSMQLMRIGETDD